LDLSISAISTSWYRKASTRTAPTSFEPYQIERHADVVRKAATRKSVDLGLRHFSRADLEAARDAGHMLDIRVLGLASIADDVPPELARATIASLSVLGALHASSAVKAALSDRMQ
jgi:hypothetical protein